MAGGQPTFADSDPGDEFSNNLFSDLAPILALFGEQVAMQFMSESMGWSDSIIFSMAPIGVLTAVIGAIRVGGARWLRALIGRAKENIAVAESELMSSTSDEVCEVFNGRHVVRLIGKPSIKELIFMKCSEEAAEGKEIAQVDRFVTLSEALNKKFLTRKNFPEYPTLQRVKEKLIKSERGASLLRRVLPRYGSQGPDPKDLESGGQASSRGAMFEKFLNLLLDGYGTACNAIEASSATLWPEDTKIKRKEMEAKRLEAISEEPPNISLNVHPHGGRTELHVIAAMGVILQVGVLVFDWFITYHPDFRQKKGGRDVRSYAFPLTCMGTLVLITGVFVCSYIIESAATAEIHLPDVGTLQMLWIQQGGSVSDQIFDSYLILARSPSDHVITSRRRKRVRGSRKDFITSILTTSGAVVSISGFVLQFVGLRSMTWYASISQLVATMIMIILRAYIRRGLSTTPWARPIPKGHEIDWVATRTSNEEDRNRLLGRRVQDQPSQKKHRSWQSVFLGTPGKNGSLHCPWDDENDDHFWDKDTSYKWKVRTVGGFSRYQPLRDGSEVLGSESTSMKHIEARMNLRTSTGWSGPALEQAVRVASAIEAFMNAFFPKDSTVENLVWSISNASASDASVDDIKFSLSRKESGWIADVRQIEAFLSLWLFSVSEEESQTAGIKIESGIAGDISGTASKNHSLRLLAPKDESILQCMYWWLGSAVALVREAEIPSAETEGVDPFDRDIELHTPKETTSNTVDDNLEGYDACQTSSAKSTLVQSIKFNRHRVVGYQDESSDDAKVLAVMSDAPLDILYAQELFSAFIRSFVQFEFSENKASTPIIKGSTKSMPVQEMDESGTVLFNSIMLEHKELDRVIKTISRSGLGSVEDIMLSILPPLIMKDMLPDMSAVIHSIRDQGRIQESYHRWEEAGEIYLKGFMAFQSRYMIKQQTAIEHATCALTEFIRELTLEINITEKFREQKYHRWEGKKFKRTEELTALRRKIVTALEDNCDGVHKVLMKINQINTWQGRVEGTEEWSFWSKYLEYIGAVTYSNWSAPEFWTELHMYVADGTAEEVKEHLQDKSRGVSDQTDFAGLTPLHYAKSKTIAKVLLEAGAPVAAKGNDGLTPLHNAARTGQKELVALLIEHGCDPNPRDNHRRTPLHWAAHGGYSTVIEVLLERHADPLVVSEHQRNPLHMAACEGHLKVVKLLVEQGKVDIGIEDSDGRTALHLAVAGNHPRVISYLSDLEKSWPEDVSGFSAIHLAAFLGHVAAVNIMLGGDRKNEQKIKERLSLQTSSTGSTALHIAARYGRISVMKCILGLWPTLQIDKLNSTGKTALMCASLHGQNDAVKLLLENGSRALITNKSDQSPLHLAARSRETGSSDVIKTLLEAKLDPGLKDADGYTPLLHAVATENIPALEVLIPVSSLDAVDNKGRDALRLAIEESAPVSEDLVKFLVSKGAEVKGKTYRVSLRGGGEWLKDYIAGEGGEVIEYSWFEELMRRRRFQWPLPSQEVS